MGRGSEMKVEGQEQKHSGLLGLVKDFGIHFKQCKATGEFQVKISGDGESNCN